ncbi:uncharacterized protein [Clytia hemisphaerica]|uniref:Uncharacterized protein n=1 Tax=Clytia hemisphaerica TaxID=252671 RepID=A0A7M5TTX7_9CNID
MITNGLTSVFDLHILLTIAMLCRSSRCYSTPHTTSYKDGSISLEDIEKEFTNSLFKVAKTLPKQKFCLKLGRYITNKNDPILNKIWYSGRLKNRKFNCKKVNGEINDISNENTDSIELMTSLYNQLPLPFQCQILTTTTLRYFAKRRKEHISETIRANQENTVELKSSRKQLLKYTRLHHDEEIFKGIKDVEKTLSVYRTLPVANQCQRLIRKQNAFSKVIQFHVKRQTNLTDIDVEIKIRKLIPNIVENYVRKNGIKIGLSLIKRHWVRTLRTLIFVTSKESNSTEEHFIFDTKLFLALGNTGPINANVALAALYDFTSEQLSQKMGFQIDFKTRIDDGAHQGKFPTDANHFQEELFMRQTFPRYLDRYFKGLRAPEQNLILDLVSVYSNQTKTKIIHVLQKEHGLKLSKFLDRPRNERRVIHTFPATSTKGQLQKNIKTHKQSTITISQLTNIEIIMIAALSCSVLFGFVFVAVFAVFQKRRKEFNRKLLEIQRNTQVTLYNTQKPNNTNSIQFLDGENNTHTSDGIVTLSESDKTVSFCTRTKFYSQQNQHKQQSMVRASTNLTVSTDIETLL